MEGLKRQVRFLLYDSKNSFIKLWVVIVVLDLISYWLNYKFSNSAIGITDMTYEYIGSREVVTKNINVAGANIIPIMIYLFINGLIMYSENFSAAVSFSSARKDFYKALIFHNIIISTAIALIETALLKFDVAMIKFIGFNPITKITFFDTKQDNAAFIFLMIFLQTLIFCAAVNLVGLLIYKFAGRFWIALGIACTIIFNIGITNITFGKLISWAFYYGSFMSFTIKILLISMVMYLLGWIFVRTMGVKASKQ